MALGFWNFAAAGAEGARAGDAGGEARLARRAGGGVEPGRARAARARPRAGGHRRGGARERPALRRALPRLLPGRASTSCRSTTTSPAPRSPTSSRTPRRRCSSTSPRFREAVEKALPELKLPATHRFSVGALPGFRPYAELSAGQSDADAREPHRRRGDELHLGHHRPPEGRAAPALGHGPDLIGALFTGFQQMFGVKPEDGNVHITGSPLYHTAVLMFASGAMHMGHTVVLMEKWTPEAMLQRIDSYKVTTSHMVPTQFHRLLQLPADVRGQATTARPRAPWCTPRRPARPTSSAA